MPTETKSERGWSKEYPSLNYGSWFWLRHAPDAEPELQQLTGGRNWMEAFGSVRDSTEFLGPITVSDLERLAVLREAVEAALTFMQSTHIENSGAVQDQLREALLSA